MVEQGSIFLNKFGKQVAFCSMLNFEQIDRVIEMAWEDRTSFDAIEMQFGITEAEVIKLMRKRLKPTSFRLWRKRVQGRKTKHAITSDSNRFKCSRQKHISLNMISKR